MRQKTLKMSDGVMLLIDIFDYPCRRMSVFSVGDVGFLCDSVLYEVFLAVGGDVCAYSALDGIYTVKLFTLA